MEERNFGLLGFFALLAFLGFLALIAWQKSQAQTVTAADIEKAREMVRRLESE